MSTAAEQDYLKAIYKLQEIDSRVSTKDLADHLEISAASVTGMLKRLADKGLVRHTRYRGAVLTSRGERVALDVLRRHRLIELFLAEIIGLPWELVHDEAEKLEHVMSDNVIERIDRILHHPVVDPHGAPIPDANGTVAKIPMLPLADVKKGRTATLACITDQDPAFLQYLGRNKLYPGSRVTIISAEPFDGPITLQVDSQKVTIGRETAGKIFVSK